MAKTLKKIFDAGSDQIDQNYTINSWHVSQSVSALTGEDAYDITISGSLTVEGPLLIPEVENAGGSYSNVVLIDTATGTLYYTGSYSVPPVVVGSSGTSGTDGADGSSGTSGTDGADGSSGTSGESGTDGSSGSSGSSGSDGQSGVTGQDTEVVYMNGDDNAESANNLRWDDSNNTLHVTASVGQPNFILSTTDGTISKGDLISQISTRPPAGFGTFNVAKINVEADNAFIAGNTYDSRIVFYTTKGTANTATAYLYSNKQLQLNGYTDDGEFPATGSSTTDSGINQNPYYFLAHDSVGKVEQVQPGRLALRETSTSNVTYKLNRNFTTSYVLRTTGTTPSSGEFVFGGSDPASQSSIKTLVSTDSTLFVANAFLYGGTLDVRNQSGVTSEYTINSAVIAGGVITIFITNVVAGVAFLDNTTPAICDFNLTAYRHEIEGNYISLSYTNQGDAGSNVVLALDTSVTQSLSIGDFLIVNGKSFTGTTQFKYAYDNSGTEKTGSLYAHDTTTFIPPVNDPWMITFQYYKRGGGSANNWGLAPVSATEFR